MLVTAAASIQSHLLTPDAFWLILLISSIIFIYAWLIYPVFHGPLSHVPGPWYAKVSSLPLALYDVLCCRNDIILDWHRQYGPIILISPGEVSVADIKATRDIYRATDQWCKSNYFDHFKGYGMRSVFATKPYEDHRKKRKYTSVFYQASTIYKLPEIEQHIRARSLSVLNQVCVDQEVDVYRLTSWYAFDNITFLALGPNLSTRSIDHSCPERGILEGLKYQQFVGPFRYRYPQIYRCITQVFQALSPRFNYLSADINFELWCQQRFNKALQDPGIYNSHSLVRHLLELKDNDIDMQYIAAEVLDNINAAEATVAVTATYLIWKLTETPRWQSIIRQELMDLTKQNDKTLSFADIDSQVPSLEACLREVYRLYPASSGRAERMVPAGGRNLLGVHLPENTTVTTSVLALHHDMEVYPNPSSFAPERWLEGDKDLLKTMEAQLIPFGYGGRICLGKALATMEIKVLMATLYLEHESLLTEATNAASMAQCSTHDAVPKALKCVVKFRKVMR